MADAEAPPVSQTEEEFKAPVLPLKPGGLPHGHSPNPDTFDRNGDNLKKNGAEESSGEQATEAPTSAAKSQVQSNIPPPPLSYGPPPWACEPEMGLGFKLEVLKNGTIVDSIDLDKRRNQSYIVIGRLPICDVVLDHPSISRYHCILQYGEDTMTKSGKGWHIFELGSTHGSKMNKNRLPAKQFIRVHVGFVMQFGGSSRLLTLTGPSDDAEPEWECSPTEMREKMQKKALEAKLAAQARKEMEEEKRREEENEGIDWGMDYGEEDAKAPLFELESHLAEDGDAFYNSDPKKALTKFFDREGFDMVFQYSESGQGHTHKWICSIELPIEIDGIDRTFTAQATVATSKKDATVQCALEACRILDKHGVLRRSTSRSRLKKKTLEENDYYDEDDDLYLDRTGQLEKQREKRKMWAEHGTGNRSQEKDTYETLTAKLEETKKEIAEVQRHLDELGSGHRAEAASEANSDNLDDYVRQLSSGSAGRKDDLKTKTEKSQLRQRLVILTHEAQKLEKLAKIAKPISLPELKTAAGTSVSKDKQAFLRKLMNVGRPKVDEKEWPAAFQRAKEHTPAFKPETEDDAINGDELDKASPSPSVSKPTATGTNNTKCKEPSSTPELVEDSSNNSKAEAVQSAPSTSTATVGTPVPKESASSESLSKKIDDRPCPKNDSEDEITSNRESKASLDRSDFKRPIPKSINEKTEAELEPKKKRVRIRHKERTEASGDYGDGCEHKDEQYATWMPPENQSGDGKTALHEKFAGRY